MCSRIRCCRRSITRCRTDTGVRRQAGNASRAAATAASNSALVVCGTRDTTSWVAYSICLLLVSANSVYRAPLLRNVQMPLHRQWGYCQITGLYTSIHSFVDESVNFPFITVCTFSCNSNEPSSMFIPRPACHMHASMHVLSAKCEVPSFYGLTRSAAGIRTHRVRVCCSGRLH